MTQATELDVEDEEEEGGLLDGIEPAEVLATVRERAVGLVTAHPVLSLVGAFAVGFALARIVKALGDD